MYENAPKAGWSDYHICHYLALATELDRPYDRIVLERIGSGTSFGPFSDAAGAFVAVMEEELDKKADASVTNLVKHDSTWSRMLALDVLYAAGQLDEARKLASEQFKRLPSTDLPEWGRWAFENLLRFRARDLSEEKFIESARNSNYPNKFLTYAHWTIALEYLADGRLEEARDHFQRCVDSRIFYLSHYWWSRAFLKRLEKTNVWPPRT